MLFVIMIMGKTRFNTPTPNLRVKRCLDLEQKFRIPFMMFVQRYYNPNNYMDLTLVLVLSLTTYR